MQLNDALAHQIVSRAMKILSFSVNVGWEEHGLVIAADAIGGLYAVK